MAYKRIVTNRVEEVFDNVQQAMEFAEGATRGVENYDITIEATNRGVWVIIEHYEWRVND